MAFFEAALVLHCSLMLCVDFSLKASLLLRMKEERPRHALHCDYIQAVAENVSIPVIARSVPDHICTLSFE